MIKAMNIILSNATIASGNRGCSALAISSLYIIHKIFSEANIDYKIFLTDSHQLPDRDYEYSIGDIRLKYTTCKYPYSIDRKKQFVNILKSLIGKNKAKNVFRNADFVFDIGQGDSFADIYGKKRFESINLIHKIARKYNIPYCLLPQTIGPYKDAAIASEANYSISQAAFCMVRDKKSMDYVINNVSSQKFVREYIDVAFFLPYEKMYQDKNYVHVGLNISALLWNGGYTGNNQFGLICDYQTVVRSIIDYFLKVPEVKVHLIPHVVAEERSVENDYEVCYELWREYNNKDVILAPFALGPIEIKSYIAGMDFFLGARMHSTIGAFSAEVPVVPMAYSRKFNGLFIDTLDYPYLIDMIESSNKEVLDSVISLYQERYHMKDIIKERMTGIVREREKCLYADLKKFLNI